MKQANNAGRWAILIALTLFASTLTVTPLIADPLTGTERQRLIDHLKHTRQLFLDSVKGLSEEQWNYKASEDRWSIAQCAEHIAASESFIRGAIEGAMASGEVAVGVEPMEDKVLAMIVDRGSKFQAPEGLQPNDRHGSPTDSLKTFKKERAKTKKLAAKSGDLRAIAADHPAGFKLDGYGWFFFLSGHTQRHTLQIEEVKASPGYPKG